MSNSNKKAIPTLVGGAILLGATPAHALENTIKDEENQIIDNSSTENKETLEDIIIEVEGEIPGGDLNNEDIISDSNNEVSINDSIAQNEVDVTVDMLEEIEDNNSATDKEVEDKKDIIVEDTKYVEEYKNLLPKERTTSEQSIMKVKIDKLSVRADVSKDSQVKGDLAKDAYVDVYSKNSKEGWAKINYKGEMAYVELSGLKDATYEYKEAVNSSVLVKSGAGDSYGNFGTLSSGDRVKVYQKLDNGWSKIIYNSKIAFVKTVDLTDTYKSKATVKVDKLNVYKDSSDSSSVLGECKKNETLFIYEESNGYYKVKFSDGYGYVKKSDLNVVENSEKPQTGDMMVFSYIGAMGVSSLGFVAVNRKNKE